MSGAVIIFGYPMAPYKVSYYDYDYYYVLRHWHTVCFLCDWT